LSKSALTTLKTAVFAPMPIASDATITKVKPARSLERTKRVSDVLEDNRSSSAAARKHRPSAPRVSRPIWPRSSTQLVGLPEAAAAIERAIDSDASACRSHEQPLALCGAVFAGNANVDLGPAPEHSRVLKVTIVVTHDCLAGIVV
jgi:hypothetical protein